MVWGSNRRWQQAGALCASLAALSACKAAQPADTQEPADQTLVLAAQGGQEVVRVNPKQIVTSNPVQCRAQVRRLFSPTLGDGWVIDPVDMYPRAEGKGPRLMAQKYASRIRSGASKSNTVIAYARRGAMLPVVKEHQASGCSGGSWYEVQGGGFVCSGSEFLLLESKTTTPKPYFREVHHLPYRYAKFHRGRHPIFSRLPSRKELAQTILTKRRGSRRFPSPVKGVSDGLQFETVVAERKIRDVTLYQNAKGDWFMANDVKILTPPVGHGVILNDGVSLPLAYIRNDDTPISCACSGNGLSACGQAKKHDVVPIHPPSKGEASVKVRSNVKIEVPRDQVRIAYAEPRPSTVPKGAKWIHVRLDEQTLVAYEGETPVFATIISSGAKGHETPPGTFRAQRKFITTTMRGSDDEFGRYTVSDVPWTLFYDGSFALHGAYWHDTFGDVRSHGCTNIPPNDARWVFHWSDPQLPVGWHGWGGVREGTYVHITDS